MKIFSVGWHISSITSWNNKKANEKLVRTSDIWFVHFPNSPRNTATNFHKHYRRNGMTNTNLYRRNNIKFCQENSVNKKDENKRLKPTRYYTSNTRIWAAYLNVLGYVTEKKCRFLLSTQSIMCRDIPFLFIR